jgi:hypothetical protein
LAILIITAIIYMNIITINAQKAFSLFHEISLVVVIVHNRLAFGKNKWMEAFWRVYR